MLMYYSNVIRSDILLKDSTHFVFIWKVSFKQWVHNGNLALLDRQHLGERFIGDAPVVVEVRRRPIPLKVGWDCLGVICWVCYCCLQS